MGMVKRLLEEYVEVVHPEDYEAQDKLMLDICEGRVEISLETMSRTVRGQNEKENQRTSDPEVR